MSFPFGKNLISSIAGEADSGNPQPSSTGGLFSSAKIVADAAQSAYKGQSFDQTKAAGAAEDILGAASTYGKLDEKGYGKYVDQAEEYLHKFRGSEEVKPPSEETKTGEPVEVKPSSEVKSEEPVEVKPSEKVTAEEPVVVKPSEEVKSEEPVEVKPSAEEEKSEEPVEVKPSAEEEKSGGGGGAGGYGDYLKQAEGFVEKYQSGGEGDGKAKKEESSGGNYFKMAEGFLKK